MLTVFGNLRINSLTRLEHFKSSFLSFNTVSDDWVINIRGTFRHEAILFLKEHLGEKLNLFEFTDESSGWIAGGLEMLEYAKHNYILVWNEDHLNIAPQPKLIEVVKDMKGKKIDYLLYSWWMNGNVRKAFDNVAEQIDFKNTNSIGYVHLTSEKWDSVKKSGYPYYLISMCGIFEREFLKKMWRRDKRKFPAFFKKLIFKGFAVLTKMHIMSPYGHKQLFSKINRRIFFNKIRKYPKNTPFEMEKDPERYDMLPLHFALPRQELFACIDDNINEEGYSLIERGIYTQGINSTTISERSQQILTEIRTVLSKVDEKEVDALVKQILSARKIIASGAGRVGMAVRGFVMRLKHLGLDAYILGDANVPSLKQDDLFLVCSGSGETQTIYELVLIAQRNQAQIALVTGNPESRMGKIAHCIVQIKAPSKVKKVENFTSIQPMTTLNEQSISIFFDALVLRLMEELNESHDTMWARHSNLE